MRQHDLDGVAGEPRFEAIADERVRVVVEANESQCIDGGWIRVMRMCVTDGLPMVVARAEEFQYRIVEQVIQVTRNEPIEAIQLNTGGDTSHTKNNMSRARRAIQSKVAKVEPWACYATHARTGFQQSNRYMQCTSPI